MNKKCSGCGVKLQINKPELEGYVEPNMYEKSTICRRCFRLKFYGDYIFVNKSSDDYIKILDKISKTGDLVIYMVDLFNISDELIYVDKLLNNPMILALSKRDLLSKSVKDKKIIDYLKTFNLDVKDIICISSEKKHNIDKLYKLMLKHKKSNNVYIIGNTNAGKSSFINKLIKQYSSKKVFITTSMLPLTTLDIMDIKLNNKVTIIDTPGLMGDGNITNYYDLMTLKKIVPRTEIKPKIYQLEPNDSLVVENIFQMDYKEGSENSFILYISNDLDIVKTNFNQGLKVFKHKVCSFDVKANQDVVISGLGWIKVIHEAQIDIIVNENVKVYIRNSII